MKGDFHLIDNGMFWPSLLSKRKEIVDLAREARVHEGKRDHEEAFDRWYKTSALIDGFEREYFNSPKIQWARNHFFARRFREIIIGIIVGVIGSAIVQYLFPSLFKFLIR